MWVRFRDDHEQNWDYAQIDDDLEPHEIKAVLVKIQQERAKPGEWFLGSYEGPICEKVKYPPPGWVQARIDEAKDRIHFAKAEKREMKKIAKRITKKEAKNG